MSFCDYITSCDDDMTRMFDDLGNQFVADWVQAGNIRGEYSIRTVLASGVSTRAIIAFEGISSRATG